MPFRLYHVITGRAATGFVHKGRDDPKDKNKYLQDNTKLLIFAIKNRYS